MTYVPKTKPWAHQQRALDKMAGHEAFALFMAMRTGKTKTLIDDFGRLENAAEVNDLMVIAPAGVYRTWEGGLKDHLPEEAQERAVVHTWRAGAGATEKRKLDAFMRLQDPRRPRVLLINIEALSNVARAQTLAVEFLAQRRNMNAIDESTTIKNPGADRTKFVVKELGDLSNYRRILSGLPTPRSPLDLYSQFQYLDEAILGFKSFYGFRARYAVMRSLVLGGRTIQVPVAYRDEDELRAKIAPYSIRVTLEECYDLPPKQYVYWDVEMTSEQQKAYEEMKAFATTEIEGHGFVSASQVIVQLLRMHQVLCGHVVTEDRKFVEIPERRTAVLLDRLEEYDGKAIIWCSYDADIQKVAKALEKKYGAGRPNEFTAVARFWGGNRNSREDEEKKFLNDPRCRFMVATAAAGGRGRTWTVADLVVYYSNTDDLEHRSQSEERPQGVGKTKSVLYADLRVPGTVDDRIVANLRKKINMAASINGDNWREWLV